MNKAIYTLILSIGLLALCGCANNPKARLQKAIVELDKMCPVNFDENGYIDGASYDQATNIVEIIYCLNPEMIDIDAFASNQNMVKNAISSTLSQPEQHDFLQLFVDAKANVNLHFKDAQSSSSFDVDMNCDELRELLDTPYSKEDLDYMQIENQVALANIGCPSLVDEGLVLSSVFIPTENTDFFGNADNDQQKGKMVVYYYDVDEGMFSIDDIKENIDLIKESIAESLDVPDIAQFIKLLISCNMNLVYYYHGEESGEVVDITFTPDELSKL